MNSTTILTALIGALATVGSSVISVVTTRLLTNPLGIGRNRRNPRQEAQHQVALVGKWEGDAHQDGLDSDEDYHIAFTIKRIGRVIRGEGCVTCSKENRKVSERIRFIGGFIHNRFLQLNYEAQNQPGMIQFGSASLELSMNGRELKGLFLGWGALYTRGPMKGTIRLSREGENRPQQSEDDLPIFAA